MWPAIRLTHQPAGRGSDCDTCMGLAWEITPPGASAHLSPLPILSKDGGTWGMHSQTYLLPDACWEITVLSSSNEAASVGSGGVGGDLVKALGPTAATGPCAAPSPPSTTSTTTPGAAPAASPAIAAVATPAFTG